MAKTFTQKNSVSFSFGDSEADSHSIEILENQMQNMIDQLKNLRVRPSFSIREILEYAKVSQQAELN
jgi:HEAT repeat protein